MSSELYDPDNDDLEESEAASQPTYSWPARSLWQRLGLIGLVVAVCFALGYGLGQITRPLPNRGTLPLPTPPPPQPLLTLNGQPLFFSDWNRAVQLDRAMSALAGRPATSTDIVLEQLINQRLCLQEAARIKLNVDTATVNQEINLLLARLGVSEARLLTELNKVGLSRDDWREEVRKLVIVQRYLETQVWPNIPAEQQEQATTAAMARLRASAGLQQATDNAPSATPTLSATFQVPGFTLTPLPAKPTLANTPTTTTSPGVGLDAGKVAPEFTLPTLTRDATQSLAQLRGRPVILNFWASWCPPCRAEMPLLQSSYERYRETGPQIIGINYQENRSQAEAFARQSSLTFPILLDEGGQVGQLYRVTALPTTFFINADGTVAARHVGALTEPLLERYLAQLQ